MTATDDESKETEDKQAGEKEQTAEEVETEEKAEGDADEPAKPSKKELEKPKELEEDAPSDSRSKLTGTAVFGSSPVDSTMNFMPTANGKLLMSLRDGGFQHLSAGGRCNVGIKSGRYMFEASIVENIQTAPLQQQGQSSGQQAKKKQQVVKLGFSTAGSSLFLNDGAEHFSIDSEGCFVNERTRLKTPATFGRGDTVALLLNLDSSSSNANTISVFKNGKRAGEPHPIPEKLKGKTLFPTVTYKNVTLQVNCGPVPLATLPFSCRMVQDAAAADVEVTQDSHHGGQTGGKHEVVFPVGIPDEGAFDWLNLFMEKNPHFTELSDRSFIDLAQKSGVWRKRGYSWRSSNDKPEMGFEIPTLDDLSAKKVLDQIAPSLKRNFVVMELKSNLVTAERKQALERFPASDFHRVATVLMGEPTEEYRTGVQELMLREKQVKARAEKRKQAAEQERNRALQERKKKVEEAKKARQAAQQKKKGSVEDDEPEEKEEEEEKKEDAMDVDETEAVELTEEEKKVTHRKLAAKDLSQTSLSKALADFSLPDKAEGFDEIRYVWQPEAACSSYLAGWLLNMKRTQRVEDLEPSAWFKDQHAAWQKAMQEWKRRQSEWKDPSRKKQLLAKLKSAKAKKDAEGEEGEESEKKEAKDVQLPEVDMEDLDIYEVEDVMNIGSGEPLFSNFVHEDWALLSFRYELHLLVYAFRKDLNDPDRILSEEHFAYYFQKYFKKEFFIKNFGFEDLSSLIEIIENTASLGSAAGQANAILPGNSILDAVLPEDTPIDRFVKIAEEHRRERVRRIDAGDETALLKFHRPAPPSGAPPRAVTGGQAGGRGGPSNGGRGGYGGGPSGGASASQKRAYTPPASSYPPSQRPRTTYGAAPGPYGSSYARSGSQGAKYGRR